MKAAFSFWNGRIAPVFDVAGQVRLVQVESGKVLDARDETLPLEPPAIRMARLSELGIDTLVCGAISRPLHLMIESCGIRVLPFLSGELAQVVAAWLGGRLEDGSFDMPGCCGQGRRRGFGGQNLDREVYAMRGGRRGAGKAQGGRGGGFSDPDAGGGEVGFCYCPKCGYREPHRRGVPCVRKQCPECGVSLVRQ